MWLFLLNPVTYVLLFYVTYMVICVYDEDLFIACHWQWRNCPSLDFDLIWVCIVCSGLCVPILKVLPAILVLLSRPNDYHSLIANKIPLKRLFLSLVHYENMPIQIYSKISPPKTEKKIRWKTLIFFIFPARRFYRVPTIYALYRNTKNNVYPCKPRFTTKKWV